MREARYLLLGVTDPGGARQWLGDLANRVTASDKPEHVRCTNIAFTYAGLAALGLDEAELTTFPTPFQEGMVSEHRQRILGDTGASAPSTWNWGGNGGDDTATSADELHAILLLFGKDAATMDEVEAQEMHWLTTSGALKVLVRLAPEPLPGQLSVGKFGVEHFGFADGMSQPVIKGSGQDSRLAGDDARRSVIEAGEFILGYANGYGQIPPWPRLTLPGDAGGDFGRNASFLVVRQLAQDVAGFWKFLSEATKEHDGSANTDEMERLGAKLVGRWRSGAPLVRAHHRDDPDLGTDNSFGYAETDPFGDRFAHTAQQSARFPRLRSEYGIGTRQPPSHPAPGSRLRPGTGRSLRRR